MVGEQTSGLSKSLRTATRNLKFQDRKVLQTKKLTQFLGLMYWRGLGVEKSIEKALECLKGAAAKGNNYARGYLAELYYKLKLFTECALSGKTVYDIYKTDDQQFMSETEQEGLAVATFLLGRCLMVSLSCLK